MANEEQPELDTLFERMKDAEIREAAAKQDVSTNAEQIRTALRVKALEASLRQPETFDNGRVRKAGRVIARREPTDFDERSGLAIIVDAESHFWAVNLYLDRGEAQAGDMRLLFDQPADLRLIRDAFLEQSKK